MRASLDKQDHAKHHPSKLPLAYQAQEKKGSFLAKRPELLQDFNDCVDFSFTPEEFEGGYDS
jgi:hypothetical protein